MGKEKVPDTFFLGGGFDRVLTLSSDGNDVLLNVERTLPARLSARAVDVLLADLFPPTAVSPAGERLVAALGRVRPVGLISPSVSQVSR